MAKLTLLLAALSGLLSVAVGAFGAHALRARLDEYSLRVFETGVQYQFYHALGLFGVALLLLRFPGNTLLQSSAWMFVLGSVLFSGSLYLLAISGVRWLGAITPLGGLAFIAGWACLGAAAWKLL
jgi:uncharacterized membrane protein YgdD (TMEM256/DUF423 family)